MKIIYKNSSVYGLVENQTDLDALIKLRDHINGDSNGIRMRKYHKIKARKRHQPWSQADIEYLKSFGKERLESCFNLLAAFERLPS